MKNIISLEDIQKHRPVADMDLDRILPHIIESQLLDLKPVLGDALFADFIQNFDVSGHSQYTNHQLLLNGVTYTSNGKIIIYSGIIPMMCYYSLSRIVTNNAVNITPYGNTFKKNEFSDPLDTNAFLAIKSELQSIGYAYQLQVVKYLQDNLSSFPLFEQVSDLKSGGTPKFFDI